MVASALVRHRLTGMASTLGPKNKNISKLVSSDKQIHINSISENIWYVI